MTPRDVLLAYPTWIIDVEVLHELRLQVKYEPDEGDRHFGVYGWEGWHDHRTPGGIMITSNALGHFTYARTASATLSEKDLSLALESAMRTISNAFPAMEKRKPRGLRHCPATNLIPRAPEEATPLRSASPPYGYSPDHYEGFFMRN